MSRSSEGRERPLQGRVSRGFTLLELLVSVSLFAIAMALAYGGLDAIVRARAQLQDDSARLGQLQFALGLLERDVRGVIARPVRDHNGRPQAALSIDSSGLQLTRAGYGNALAQPRAELERVHWQQDDHGLQRWRYSALDRIDPRPLPAVAVLDRVNGVEFSALDNAGRWHSRWPDPRAAAVALPRAVRVRLRLADYGDIERLLELPDSEPQP